MKVPDLVVQFQCQVHVWVAYLHECLLIAWQVKLLKSSISRDLKLATDEAAIEELTKAKAVLEGHGPGGDLRKLLKQPTPALLKLLLGQHCNVVTLQVTHLPARCRHN